MTTKGKMSKDFAKKATLRNCGPGAINMSAGGNPWDRMYQKPAAPTVPNANYDPAAAMQAARAPRPPSAPPAAAMLQTRQTPTNPMMPPSAGIIPAPVQNTAGPNPAANPATTGFWGGPVSAAALTNPAAAYAPPVWEKTSAQGLQRGLRMADGGSPWDSGRGRMYNSSGSSIAGSAPAATAVAPTGPLFRPPPTPTAPVAPTPVAPTPAAPTAPVSPLATSVPVPTAPKPALDSGGAAPLGFGRTPPPATPLTSVQAGLAAPPVVRPSNLAGLRDGGRVNGPGGPTDDMIGPVYLSKNEYVLPADTVAAMGGKQALDGLRAQTHDFEKTDRIAAKRGPLPNGAQGLMAGTSGDPYVRPREILMHNGQPDPRLNQSQYRTPPTAAAAPPPQPAAAAAAQAQAQTAVATARAQAQAQAAVAAARAQATGGTIPSGSPSPGVPPPGGPPGGPPPTAPPGSPPGGPPGSPPGRFAQARSAVAQPVRWVAGKAVSGAKNVGKLGVYAAGVKALADNIDTGTERYEKRFGIDAPDNFVGHLGLRALGFASDLGNAMTFGQAGKYLFRDMQPEKGAPVDPATQGPGEITGPGDEHAFATDAMEREVPDTGGRIIEGGPPGLRGQPTVFVGGNPDPNLEAQEAARGHARNAGIANDLRTATMRHIVDGNLDHAMKIAPDEESKLAVAQAYAQRRNTPWSLSGRTVNDDNRERHFGGGTEGFGSGGISARQGKGGWDYGRGGSLKRAKLQHEINEAARKDLTDQRGQDLLRQSAIEQQGVTRAGHEVQLAGQRSVAETAKGLRQWEREKTAIEQGNTDRRFRFDASKEGRAARQEGYARAQTTLDKLFPGEEPGKVDSQAQSKYLEWIYANNPKLKEQGGISQLDPDTQNQLLVDSMAGYKNWQQRNAVTGAFGLKPRKGTKVAPFTGVRNIELGDIPDVGFANYAWQSPVTPWTDPRVLTDTQGLPTPVQKVIGKSIMGVDADAQGALPPEVRKQLEKGK